ncbi:FMN-binding negative transcriptional regulator [Aquella oligotrophica]|uniref:Transcriptional regulator n=1 Tax=Aquella oligotrophica TaxID=2067065 RepID=A0A2I7N2V8_9NEIS|nr:FMN-binding negative transcriptional regulator [Aquella oligotrophica]AUR50786.1 transcriptional regulator [Aquella oligotrophica]
MYQPKSFIESDQDKLYSLIENYPFATLISKKDGEIEISHLPLLLDRENGQLLGHIARANPLLEYILTGQLATAIFHGPHGYISPAWYQDPTDNVPTWNYAVVHIEGKLIATTEAELMKLLDQLYLLHDKSKMPINWQNPKISAKLNGIAGFKIKIEKMTGKYKLSQNRSFEDRRGVIRNLNKNNSELCDIMNNC